MGDEEKMRGKRRGNIAVRMEGIISQFRKTHHLSFRVFASTVSVCFGGFSITYSGGKEGEKK